MAHGNDDSALHDRAARIRTLFKDQEDFKDADFPAAQLIVSDKVEHLAATACYIDTAPVEPIGLDKFGLPEVFLSGDVNDNAVRHITIENKHVHYTFNKDTFRFQTTQFPYRHNHNFLNIFHPAAKKKSHHASV